MPESTPPPTEVKPPVMTKAPPAGKKFPCPACGARLDFDPAAGGLKCPYCGYSEIIEDSNAEDVVERDYLDYLDREEAKGVAIPGRSTQTRCTGCGAVVLLEDNVVTEACPFCGTHLENQPEVAAAMIPPESLLPFRVDLRRARDRFTVWLQSLWFAPTELHRIATLGQLTGVYLPYWTYDSMTYTQYTGQRGDDYTETIYVTVTRPDGRTEQQPQTVIRTRWWPVSGEVQHFFDDVLICASKSLPGDLINDLGDWQLEKLTPFKPEYLSGFRTERYAVGLKDGFTAAKQAMDGTIVTLIRQDIGGDHQQISSRNTRHRAVTFKPLLLPLWVAVYRYQETTYQILVNGRTGKVTGYRPYSWVKITGAVLLVIAVVLLVFVLVSMMQR